MQNIKQTIYSFLFFISKEKLIFFLFFSNILFDFFVFSSNRSRSIPFARSSRSQHIIHSRFSLYFILTFSVPVTLHIKKAVPPNWTVVLCAIIWNENKWKRNYREENVTFLYQGYYGKRSRRRSRSRRKHTEAAGVVQYSKVYVCTEKHF